MVALISGCVMMVNALSDAMLCILTVQGWVHDRAGLGARLCRAGCTTVQGWVHRCAGLGAQMCMDGAHSCFQKGTFNGTFLGRHLSVGRTFVFHHDHGNIVALSIAVSVYLNG